ncbi:substrate-binding periplasmic protein [Chitinimonas sp. PSY-7]|uniref:transporter substrate-binding domain-containing protein n=1 Tax=Chitinimonas sp. PSY-7 TaxID=3459088 RepID=UPI00403FE08D
MKSLGWFFALLILASFGVYPLAAGTALQTAAQESVAPKFIMEEGRAATGLCPDVFQAITALDSGLQFEGLNHQLSTARIEQGLAQGQLDIFCGLLRTEKREKIALFLEPPIYSMKQRVAVRADDPIEPTNLTMLRQASEGSSVITTAGAPYADMLRSAGIEVDAGASDNRDNLRKLIMGRGRFLYLSDYVMHNLLVQEKAETKVRVLAAVFSHQPLYFVTSMQMKPTVRARLEAALRTLAAQGELDRIAKRYLPE